MNMDSHISYVSFIIKIVESIKPNPSVIQTTTTVHLGLCCQGNACHDCHLLSNKEIKVQLKNEKVDINGCFQLGGFWLELHSPLTNSSGSSIRAGELSSS